MSVLGLTTLHRFIHANAEMLNLFPENSVELVVTSPPYPIIQMWDETFSALNPCIRKALQVGDGSKAFELMHACLWPVWQELFRVLCPGGFVCINIGDAVRSLGHEFRLYPNHAKLESDFAALGFSELPCIIWRKTTNAPNKFMGSGMLPAGAYVTLEHEYILIFKKPGHRPWNQKKFREQRRLSALFWEERNQYYSDLWQLIGERQDLNAPSRSRSAAFPFELARRLISMYSLIGDTVLDPFAGTATTASAAAALGRHSLNFELDASLLDIAEQRFEASLGLWQQQAQRRLAAHREFCEQHQAKGGRLIYQNKHYGFPVKTSQEVELYVPIATHCERLSPNQFLVSYQ